MGSYRHLSWEDREEIAVLRAAGHSNAGIAAALGRSPSTISQPEAGYVQKGGKRGVHTEHLGYLLAEMQFLQRAYPGATW